MKLTRLLSTSVAFGVAALLPSIATAKDKTPIPVDQSEVLQIVVYDNVMRKSQDSWTSPRLERERYLVMKNALENSAKKIGYEGPIKIEQFAAGLKDANQRLTLYVYRWEQGMESFGRSMTVEFAMDATLRVGDQEWDMGAFTARNSHYASGGVSSEEYIPSAERAIEQMIELYRSAIADAATMGK